MTHIWDLPVFITTAAPVRNLRMEGLAKDVIELFKVAKGTARFDAEWLDLQEKPQTLRGRISDGSLGAFGGLSSVSPDMLFLRGRQSLRSKTWEPEETEWLCQYHRGGDGVHHSVNDLLALSVRLHHIWNGLHGWKDWVRASARVMAGHGALGCGVVDVCRAHLCDYGYWYHHHSRETSLERAMLLERWSRRTKAGVDLVPWISAAAIVSAATMSRAGGPDCVELKLKPLIEGYRFRKGPLVEPIEHGEGAYLIWTIPSLEVVVNPRDVNGFIRWLGAAEQTLEATIALRELGIIAD